MANDAFPPGSRYHDLEVAKLELADGRRIAYVRRRFVPQPTSFALLREHVVRPGERMDTIAAQHLGDPEQYWRIADANGAIAPERLTDEPARRLRITLPAGVPGAAED